MPIGIPEIKEFFTFTENNCFNAPAVTIDDVEIARFRETFERRFHEELLAAGRGGPGEATAEDLQAHIWRIVAADFIRAREDHNKEDTPTRPKAWNANVVG